MQHLFQPLTAGALRLPNRILMAPLTRARAEAGHTPGALMATYYAQRASAGLIIAEATMAMAGYSAFWNEPGIYSDAQITGWKQVTDAVHAAGFITDRIDRRTCGKMFEPASLKHGTSKRYGRVAEPAPAADDFTRGFPIQHCLRSLQ